MGKGEIEMEGRRGMDGMGCFILYYPCRVSRVLSCRVQRSCRVKGRIAFDVDTASYWCIVSLHYE